MICGIRCETIDFWVRRSKLSQSHMVCPHHIAFLRTFIVIQNVLDNGVKEPLKYFFVDFVFVLVSLVISINVWKARLRNDV